MPSVSYTPQRDYYIKHRDEILARRRLKYVGDPSGWVNPNKPGRKVDEERTDQWVWCNQCKTDGLSHFVGATKNDILRCTRCGFVDKKYTYYSDKHHGGDIENKLRIDRRIGYTNAARTKRLGQNVEPE